MLDKLKEHGLMVRESDNPDRDPIDFTIEDGNDNVCWVWGTTLDDVQVECDHAVVTYGKDDDEQGECVVCGAVCDWHWENDSGSVEDHHWEGKERIPHRWYRANVLSGLVGQHLKETQMK